MEVGDYGVYSDNEPTTLVRFDGITKNNNFKFSYGNSKSFITTKNKPFTIVKVNFDETSWTAMQLMDGVFSTEDFTTAIPTLTLKILT